ncbi:MAG TPA: BadF/BadG/BcrA/BcrD ATPase family protein [Longimicrobiales bacterium]|nr:BadF/BadG/BcrA/BcrD ATPase family protein [Longimicrobiales bacterium]
MTGAVPGDRPTAGHVAGIDGGGTSTTIALADLSGREILRRSGPAALVEPGDPAASADVLAALIRDAAADAEVTLPLAALCAGLAGAGTEAARSGVREALVDARLARTIRIVGDGEIALEGALPGRAGVLLVAGTGSVAYGRGGNGRVARCGGWGWRVGDEGSGYAIARAGLRGALHAADGRGPQTALLPGLLDALGLAAPEEIPSWAGRVSKGAVAAVAPRVVALAESGDTVAGRIVDAAAGDLLRHVCALIERLAPWSEPVPVVFHGGVFREAAFARRVEERLVEIPVPLVREHAAADAVTGAVLTACGLPLSGAHEHSPTKQGGGR